MVQAGRTGRAILHYRRAVLQAPRDPDIRANLQFARDRSGLTQPPLANLLEEVVSRLRADEWAALFALSVWTSLIILIALKIKPGWTSALRPYGVASVLSALLAGGALAAWWHAHRSTERYVVELSATGQTVLHAKFGPLEESQTAFSMKDGTEVLRSGVKGDWVQVTDNGQRTGWVPRSSLAGIQEARR